MYKLSFGEFSVRVLCENRNSFECVIVQLFIDPPQLYKHETCKINDFSMLTIFFSRTWIIIVIARSDSFSVIVTGIEFEFKKLVKN